METEDYQHKSDAPVTPDSSRGLASARPSLRDDSRERAHSRIIQGALAGIAASGLDVTVDEVAERSGVSRRTVFRHFANHSELIAATLVELQVVLAENIPGPPAPGVAVEAWLLETIAAMHRLQRALIGNAFWDLYSGRASLSTEVAEQVATAFRVRMGFAARIATDAWEALGGEGAPPAFVIDAFGMYISGFVVNAMASYSDDELAAFSARVLLLVLTDALAKQP